MKQINKKLVIPVVVILILLTGIITAILLNSGTVVMSLKSECASFVEKDGIITEVKFHAPVNFNAIQLDSESKTSCDGHGNEYQTITYNGSVKKALFASMPTATINRSCTYVFVFSDKTVTIVDGTISDSQHK